MNGGEPAAAAPDAIASALLTAGLLVLLIAAGETSLWQRHLALAVALALLVAGAGMYLLLICITRYVQTPRAAGYGFGLDTFTAGLFLVPFTALALVIGLTLLR